MKPGIEPQPPIPKLVTKTTKSPSLSTKDYSHKAY